MTGQTCSCGEAVHAGTYLCRQCVRTLDVALANIAVHDSDLETLRSKLTRYGSSGTTKGGLGKSQPLVLDLRFAPLTNARVHDEWQVPGKEGQGTQLHHDVRNTLTTWARVCLDTWPVTTPADHVPGLCAFLQGILTAVAGQPWAGELLADMLRLEQALVRIVDRPADRWYAGKCSALRPGSDGSGLVVRAGLDTEPVRCQRELYATAESGTLRCQACGTEHDVAERRGFLLKEARDFSVTATEAAGALLAWTDYDGSETKLVDLIGKWRDRGQVEVADVISLLGKDRHLYRLGDIQDLLVAHAQREQERRIRRPA